MAGISRGATCASDDGTLMTCTIQATVPKLSLGEPQPEELEQELGQPPSQTPQQLAWEGLSELLLWRLSLRSPQAELRNSGLNCARHQRAVVASALGQSVVVAHQAPIAAIRSHPAVHRPRAPAADNDDCRLGE